MKIEQMTTGELTVYHIRDTFGNTVILRPDEAVRFMATFGESACFLLQERACIV